MTASEILSSGYMNKVFSGSFKKNVMFASRKLKAIEFDYIIMTGVSGITFGAALCYKMDKRPIVIRKSIEGSHASFRIEGYPVGEFRAIIIDDLTCTHDTMRRIGGSIKSFVGLNNYKGVVKPDIRAIYLYESNWIKADKPDKPDKSLDIVRLAMSTGLGA